MNTQRVLQTFQNCRLIPIISGKNPQLVIKIAKLLVDSSLPVIEVALRDKDSLSSLSTIRKAFPQMVIGGGTIISKIDAQLAIDNGADFLISPGIDVDVAKLTQRKKIPYIPGVATSSEIQLAMSLGSRLLKWFPAKTLGGPEALSLINGPFGYHGIQFIPSGGITDKDYLDYLKLKNVIAVGGSFIIPDQKLVEKNEQVAIKHIKNLYSAAVNLL